MVNNINSIMYNLELLNERNSKVNHGLSTGEALEYGSDDSIKYDYILGVKNDLNTYSSIEEGINYNSAFNTASDTALSNIKTATEAIKVELIKANTDTTASEEKAIIATQIDDYKNTLYSLANSSVNDQYLFSGVNTGIEPFSIDETTGQVSYQSDNSTKTLNVEKSTYVNQGVNGIDVFYYVEQNIEDNESFNFSSNEIIIDEEGNEWKLLDTNSDGIEDGLYLNGDTSSSSISVMQNPDGTFEATNSSGLSFEIKHSTFDLLDEITDALRLQDSDGNSITQAESYEILSSSMEKLDTAYNRQNTTHALVGIRTSNIENYGESIQSKITNLSILEEQYAGADLTALAIEAQSLENTYTALYSTINRVNSLSLVNYLN